MVPTNSLFKEELSRMVVAPLVMVILEISSSAVGEVTAGGGVYEGVPDNKADVNVKVVGVFAQNVEGLTVIVFPTNGAITLTVTCELTEHPVEASVPDTVYTYVPVAAGVKVNGLFNEVPIEAVKPLLIESDEFQFNE
jgi:hypothetical protein